MDQVINLSDSFFRAISLKVIVDAPPEGTVYFSAPLYRKRVSNFVLTVPHPLHIRQKPSLSSSVETRICHRGH